MWNETEREQELAMRILASWGATSKGISLVPSLVAQVEKLRLLTCKKKKHKRQRALVIYTIYIYIFICISVCVCVRVCVSTTRNGKNIDSKNKQAKFLFVPRTSGNNFCQNIFIGFPSCPFPTPLNLRAISYQLRPRLIPFGTS